MVRVHSRQRRVRRLTPSNLRTHFSLPFINNEHPSFLNMAKKTQYLIDKSVTKPVQPPKTNMVNVVAKIIAGAKKPSVKK